jgi:hypothetical protein
MPMMEEVTIFLPYSMRSLPFAVHKRHTLRFILTFVSNLTLRHYCATMGSRENWLDRSHFRHTAVLHGMAIVAL